MKKAVNLTYHGEYIKEFFVRASKLYKKAKFNEGTKHGMVLEFIMPDKILLKFVLLRKVRTFEEVKETCMEYSKHQKAYSLPKQASGNASTVLIP